MLRLFPFCSLTRNSRRRSSPLLSLFAILIALPAALCQAAVAPSHNPALKPPPGAKVAIVEFDDMECPACAAANPVLMQAVANYHIPWVRHDFLIPGHPWSPEAAVYARWFDTKSKEIGSEYRNAVFANQPSIYSRRQLLTFTQKFAASHGLQLPFMVDPQGKLAAEVKADVALGRSLDITQTPTIFIVMSHADRASYIKVKNPEQDLYKDIDQAIQDTR